MKNSEKLSLFRKGNSNGIGLSDVSAKQIIEGLQNPQRLSDLKNRNLDIKMVSSSCSVSDCQIMCTLNCDIGCTQGCQASCVGCTLSDCSSRGTWSRPNQ